MKDIDRLRELEKEFREGLERAPRQETIEEMKVIRGKLVRGDNPTLTDGGFVSAVDLVKKDPVFLAQIAADLQKICFQEQGLGLAAPQIGYPHEIALVQINKEQALFMLDPVVLNSTSAVEFAAEGCLSYPGEQFLVPRSRELTVKFFDLHGRKNIRRFKGFFGRVVQHEIDHLQGITVRTSGTLIQPEITGEKKGAE